MSIPRPIADWLVITTSGEPGVAEPPEGLGGAGQEPDLSPGRTGNGRAR